MPSHDTLVIIDGPLIEPVSIEEAKLQARIALELTEEDGLIGIYVEAARKQVENETGRTLLETTYEWKLACFPHGRCPLVVPKPPLLDVEYITYIDPQGVTQPWTAYDVQTDDESPGRVTPTYGQVWPATRRQPGAVTVRFMAGYGYVPTDVPAGLRTAILLWQAHLYENREAVGDKQVYEVPFAVERLMWPYRTAGVLIA